MTATKERPSTLISRNARCPCNSQLRYKDCCGKHKVTSAQPTLDAPKYAALTAQLAGNYAVAERLYRDALKIAPLDADALHMLALTQYQQGCVNEALATYLDLLKCPEALPETVAHNLSLSIAAATYTVDSPEARARREAYGDWLAEREHLPAQRNARVSVVLPSYNHAPFIGRALHSVLAQSRLPDEVIVIDDGSRDDSVARIQTLLAATDITHVFIARENRGAAQTLNEAIERATGDWIAPLNSDDFFDTQRLARMLNACAHDGIDWGFGSIDVVDQTGAKLPRTDDSVGALYATHDSIDMSESLGLSFLRNNPAISTGNLFFRKSLWQAVGGFAPLRYNHDWQFCLQASLLTEPVFVPDARYGYRWHASNTIREDPEKPRREVDEMMRQFVQTATVPTALVAPRAMADQSVTVQHNPFAPTPAVWGNAFWATLAVGGGLSALPRDMLLALVTRLVRLSPSARV